MVERIIEKGVQVIALVLAGAFLLAVMLNFANVVGRYVFTEAILGADEIQVFVMIWMTFVGAIVVTWRNQHLRMDVLFCSLPKPVQKSLRLFELVLLAVLAGFVVFQSVRYVGLMIRVGRTSEAASVPMAIPHAAILIGFAAMGLLSLLRLWLTLGRKKGPAE